MISREHEESLKEFIKELEQQGYRVIKTNKKVPDAIASKDGKLYAVEMMGQKRSKNKSWVNRTSKKQKIIEYGMYDEVLFRAFRYKPKT